MRVDEAPGVKFSFAPSLALDNDRAIAAVFFDIVEPNRWAGFDAALVPLSRGKIDGAKRPLTQFVRASIDNKAPAYALATRFPALAPSPARGKDGRVWLDVLETYITMGVDDSAKLIVWHRVDVTDMLKR
jgi:hypothetical protein